MLTAATVPLLPDDAAPERLCPIQLNRPAREEIGQSISGTDIEKGPAEGQQKARERMTKSSAM